jgi:hypothetical protein
MKNILVVIIAAILTSGTVVAQPIVGIGDLKIGMAEAEFLELPEIKTKSIADAAEMPWDFHENFVFKTTRDSSFADSRKNMRVFAPGYIQYTFKMAAGIKDRQGADLYVTTLDFYKGELIQITLNTLASSFPDFLEILTGKYGKPIETDARTKEVCQNGYGARVERKNGNIVYGWRGRGPIEAEMVHSFFGCEFNAYTYTVRNSKKRALLDSLDARAKVVAEVERLKSKANASPSRL